jgi:hypothetical protein
MIIDMYSPGRRPKQIAVNQWNSVLEKVRGVQKKIKKVNFPLLENVITKPLFTCS